MLGYTRILNNCQCFTVFFTEFSYDQEVEYKLNESDDLRKLILIGHNDSGKTNVLRLIELMLLATNTQDINLQEYNARYIKGAENANSKEHNTSPVFKIKLQMSNEFCETLAKDIVSILYYFNWSELVMDPFTEFKKFIDDLARSVSSIEIHYIERKSNSTLKFHIFIELFQMYLDDLFVLLEEYYLWMYNCRGFTPQTFQYNHESKKYIRNITNGNPIQYLKETIYNEIYNNITILTQDRGLLQNKLSNQVFTYDKIVKSIIEEYIYNHKNFNNINNLLEELTGYKIIVEYTLKDFLVDLYSASSRQKLHPSRLYQTKTAKYNYSYLNLRNLIENMHGSISSPEEFKRDIYWLKYGNVDPQELQEAIYEVFNCVVDCTKEEFSRCDR